MNNSKDLANRFREVTLSGKLIAFTNYQEQLNNTSFKEANYKVGKLNTIAALTFHIDYYVKGVLDVLKGGDLTIKDQFSFDMPPLNSEADWYELRNTFIINAEEFAKEIEALPEDIWDKDFVNPKYGTYQRNIEAMIEHCYYHFGQIVILKKLIPSD